MENIVESQLARVVTVPLSSITQFIEMIDGCMIGFTCTDIERINVMVGDTPFPGLAIEVGALLVVVPDEIQTALYGSTRTQWP